MDPHRFDALARTLITAPSRRSVFISLLGGVSAPLLTAHDVDGKRRGRGRRDMHQGSLAAEKKGKKRRKRKKPIPAVPPPPPGCVPACGGKTCGPDGCGKSCGSCASGETCVSGQCLPESASCTPACTGGQICQPNGQCVCPPDKPLFGGWCGQTCRACCIDEHCGSGADCRHDLGSICECWPSLHRCADGACYSCCIDDHCRGRRAQEHGFICNENGACACPEGQTECPIDVNTSQCVNIQGDRHHCGGCGRSCGGYACVNSVCVAE